MRVNVACFLHQDTIGYLETLKREWGLPSKSDVIEELIRKRWKGDQVRAMKKLAKKAKAA